MDRSAARAAAMKLLYEWEMGGNGGEDTRLGLLEIQPGEEEADYMEETVSGVQQHVQEIDGASTEWIFPSCDWASMKSLMAREFPGALR